MMSFRQALRNCAICCLILSGCSFAPTYQVPDAITPTTYKEESGDWIKADLMPTALPADWWKNYNDPQLNLLEDQVTAANQTLQLAVAQYDQARATARAARAAYFPSISGNASANHQQSSRTQANNAPNNLYNDFTLGADLSYEVDVWGRVRNTVAANEDQAEASADDLAGVALSLHAELATDYFALCGDDAAQAILDQTVDADQEALSLTQRLYKGGAAAESDVDQAETQLQTAKTQATEMRLQRSQLEHAIAVLTGHAPADFNMPTSQPTLQVPVVTPLLPSVLLQRRPDIAAAERRVAAANAQIGVARAAWFPVFNLEAMLGVQSASASRWLTAPSQFWSLGPQAVVPLFEGGLISAVNQSARAAYQAAVADYRQSVLTAYNEVEDSLAALHRLEQENSTETAAAVAAERALVQANDRYKGGLTSYLDVVVAQNTALQAKLNTITILVRRLTASVQLMKAMGGGWQVTPQNQSEKRAQPVVTSSFDALIFWR